MKSLFIWFFSFVLTLPAMAVDDGSVILQGWIFRDKTDQMIYLQGKENEFRAQFGVTEIQLHSEFAPFLGRPVWVKGRLNPADPDRPLIIESLMTPPNNVFRGLRGRGVQLLGSVWQIAPGNFRFFIQDEDVIKSLGQSSFDLVAGEDTWLSEGYLVNLKGVIGNGKLHVLSEPYSYHVRHSEKPLAEGDVVVVTGYLAENESYTGKPKNSYFASSSMAQFELFRESGAPQYVLDPRLGLVPTTFETLYMGISDKFNEDSTNVLMGSVVSSSESEHTVVTVTGTYVGKNIVAITDVRTYDPDKPLEFTQEVGLSASYRAKVVGEKEINTPKPDPETTSGSKKGKPFLRLVYDADRACEGTVKGKD